MLDKTPLINRKPIDFPLSLHLHMCMFTVADIYTIEHDYDDEQQRLDALKKYMYRKMSMPGSKKAVPDTYLATLALGDIPDSWTYDDLRLRLASVLAEHITVICKTNKMKPPIFKPTQIQRFFMSIRKKQNENDKGQDVAELCDMFNIEWRTIKNFKRLDHYCMDVGIVRSKTDKITKITYVYRDPSKKFYGREEPTFTIESKFFRSIYRDSLNSGIDQPDE